MEVRMLKTTQGSDRNAHGGAMPVAEYLAGKTYDIGTDLARLFLIMKVAVPGGSRGAKATEDKGTANPVAETASQSPVAVASKKKQVPRAAPETKSV